MPDIPTHWHQAAPGHLAVIHPTVAVSAEGNVIHHHPKHGGSIFRAISSVRTKGKADLNTLPHIGAQIESGSGPGG
jgi:hypothetical protein